MRQTTPDWIPNYDCPPTLPDRWGKKKEKGLFLSLYLPTQFATHVREGNDDFFFFERQYLFDNLLMAPLGTLMGSGAVGPMRTTLPKGFWGFLHSRAIHIFHSIIVWLHKTELSSAKWHASEARMRQFARQFSQQCEQNLSYNWRD